MSLTQEDLHAIRDEYADPTAKEQAVTFAVLEDEIMVEINKLKAKLGLSDIG